ncbi:MAG: FeoB-associated Cys-rich membrane protein [Thermoanaerobaculia bacterium]
MSLPLADPQFWIVTAVAAGALGLVLRRLFRRPKAGALPCAHCPKAGLGSRPDRPR